MSTATYLWALAFCSTSLPAAVPGGAEAGVADSTSAAATEATGEATGVDVGVDVACRLAAVEAELALAREPDLYLVLDLDEGRLEAAVRGVRFDPVPATLERSMRSSEDAPAVPQVHRVSASAPPPAGRARRPSEGAPPSESATSKMTDAGPSDPTPEPSLPGATPIEIPVEIPVEGGGALELRASTPFARGAGPLRDEPPDAASPGHLVLTLPADALARVRHRLRPGVGLLVLPECDGPRRGNR